MSWDLRDRASSSETGIARESREVANDRVSSRPFHGLKATAALIVTRETRRFSPSNTLDLTLSQFQPGLVLCSLKQVVERNAGAPFVPRNNKRSASQFVELPRPHAFLAVANPVQ